MKGVPAVCTPGVVTVNVPNAPGVTVMFPDVAETPPSVTVYVWTPVVRKVRVKTPRPAVHPLPSSVGRVARGSPELNVTGPV